MSVQRSGVRACIGEKVFEMYLYKRNNQQDSDITARKKYPCPKKTRYKGPDWLGDPYSP